MYLTGRFQKCRISYDVVKRLLYCFRLVIIIKLVSILSFVGSVVMFSAFILIVDRTDSSVIIIPSEA